MLGLREDECGLHDVVEAAGAPVTCLSTCQRSLTREKPAIGVFRYEFLTVRSATEAPEAACLSCQSVLVRRGATDLSVGG